MIQVLHLSLHDCDLLLTCPQLFLYSSLLFLLVAMSQMPHGSIPPFTMRFGEFKRIRHRERGVPEPPNILLVMDLSNYTSADEYTDQDFDEDLMLNQMQLMSIHSQNDLHFSTVEDLKRAAQQWLWNPLGLDVPTSQFVLVLKTDASLDPHWHGRKMLLHYGDTWKVLTTWQV